MRRTIAVVLLAAGVVATTAFGAHADRPAHARADVIVADATVEYVDIRQGYERLTIDTMDPSRHVGIQVRLALVDVDDGQVEPFERGDLVEVVIRPRSP